MSELFYQCAHNCHVVSEMRKEIEDWEDLVRDLREKIRKLEEKK